MTASNVVPTDHPLYNPAVFFIPTPMIDEIKERIDRWLWCGASGGYILGEARIGKTRALQYLSQHLETRTGERLPVVRLTVKARDVKTITNIWRNLLYAIGQAPASTREKADTMAPRVINYLAEQALTNASRQIVLVVDEFQRLLLQQFGAFAELYDELSDIGIQLVTVLVGNAGECEALVQRAQEHENQHLHGRFFTQNFRSYGLRSQAQLKACLRAMDTVRHPAETGPTLTQSFLPTLYAQGWCLTSLSAPLWQVYREEYGKPLQLTSWPMQYFLSTMKTLILDYIPNYGVDSAEIIEDMIRQSLAVSGMPCDLVHNE